MKNIWRKVLYFFVIGLAVGTVAPVVTMANTVDVEPYTKEAVQKHEEAVKKIEIAKETKTQKDIRAAYRAFIDISPELTPKNFDAYKSGDKMDQVFADIVELVYYTPSTKKEQEQTVLTFMQEWKKVLIERENINSLYTHHFMYVVLENTLPNIQTKLDELGQELNRYMSGVITDEGELIPLPTDKEMQSSIEDYFKEHGGQYEDPKRPDDKEIEREINQDYKQLDEDTVAGETIRYEKINGVWFEITERLRGGKLVETSRRQMSASESYFLEVRENPFYDPYNDVGSIQYITEREWSYYTSDQNVESRYTIHYTINKDEANPYYYDTGMRVDANKAASYQQIKDVLTLLSENLEEFTVEDKAKYLAVIEGKPIVIHDSKETYSKNELESWFEDFEKADIRIMETSIGQAHSLEESIVSNNADRIEVDGTEITLDTNPIVKNDRILLPLREIVSALGGTVTQDGDRYTATKDNAKVTFRTDDKSVYVNGKRMTLSNPPMMEGNTVMVEVSELAISFNYTMTWESDSQSLKFSSR